MEPIIVLHHHEITLKGENRKHFERHLLRNVRAVLTGFSSVGKIGGGYGRFIVHLNSVGEHEEITSRLSRVFGVANIWAGIETQQSIAAFNDATRQLLDGRSFKTIRIETRRVDKSFPIGSMDVNRQVGEFVCTNFNVRANLTKPDETISIEIVDGTAYVCHSKMPGAGGLPSGISGRVVSLISAGFDSPVASWKLMRRGATIIPVHFHSMPYTSQSSIDQVRQLVGVLTQYQLRMKLYLVPFAEVQQEIVLHTPMPLRVILYRRMMVRIAEAIAQKERVEALVTGEAVGQVASQTLRNIRVIDAVATLPILRPLSGTDKEETMALARRIGTYELSKEPYDDCCSFLAPRRPETWANITDVCEAETKLDIPRLVEVAVSKVSTEEFTYPQVAGQRETPD